MTAKEYLSQIAALKAKIKQETEELEMIRAAATSITAFFSEFKVQSGSISDRVGNNASKAVDMANRVENDIIDLLEVQHKIIVQIQALSNSKYIELLFKRYVEGKKLSRYIWRIIIDI